MTDGILSKLLLNSTTRKNKSQGSFFRNFPDQGTENMENATEHSYDEIRRIKRICSRAVKREIRKCEKQKIERQESCNWLFYKQIADSLLALPDSGNNGIPVLQLENVHTGDTVEVSLNPRLTLRKNAAWYYKKSQKAKRGHDIACRKVAETQERITRLSSFKTDIEEVLYTSDSTDSETVLENITGRARELGLVPGIQQQKKKQEDASTPFYHFYDENWDIYAGRNARQNDELTTRFARPADIWLHVAAHSGSHVLIRRPKGTSYPPEYIIRKAAMLAVWYSKARHTSFAEVHVTEVRYIRKPRKAPPGEVRISNYKSVRTEPKSPKELFSQ
ncbi:MAG: DUF814 domain-containing protein [Chitinivibrionales bacterium]|nr:DUF814 domain-containing protein [Chitinivibrionales bacterium]